MPEAPKTKKASFSQKHPFLFGLLLIMAALVLFMGAMAAFRLFFGDGFRGFASERIGLVRVEGLIADSEPVTRWIRTLSEDDSVKGVVLRINSPGGVVAPSQEIFAAVRRLASRKPVVASMAAAAASGGYYVAAPATVIVANPGTLTGSIGVKAELTNLQGLMEKLGIRQELVASGDYKGAGSPFSPLSEEHREYLRELVMDLHGQFVRDVAESREMELGRVEALADGRAFSGRKALELGLVDELGGLEHAFALVKAKCGLTGSVPLLEGPPKHEPLLLRLLMHLGLAPPDGLADMPGLNLHFR